MTHRDDQARFEREYREGTPRAARAMRVAQAMMGVMRDYIPRTGDCLSAIERRVVVDCFIANVEIVNVPLEWDALGKVEIEAARLKAMTERVTLVVGAGNSPLDIANAPEQST